LIFAHPVIQLIALPAYGLAIPSPQQSHPQGPGRAKYCISIKINAIHLPTAQQLQFLLLPASFDTPAATVA
jgi:hypothetical protein